MDQLIRHAQDEKGFSQIILLGIITVLMLARVGGFLVLPEKRMLPSEKIAQQEVPSKDMTSPIESA